MQQGVELVVDLGLTSGTHLVVSTLDLDADISQRPRHLVTQICVVVNRRHREVATLVTSLVALVAALFFATGVPLTLDRVNVVVTSVGLGLEAHVVEDIELGFRTEEGRVSDSTGFEVSLSLGGHLAGVTAVGLVGERITDGEVHHQRLLGTERVDVGGGRVWNQLHI